MKLPPFSDRNSGPRCDQRRRNIRAVLARIRTSATPARRARARVFRARLLRVGAGTLGIALVVTVLLSSRYRRLAAGYSLEDVSNLDQGAVTVDRHGHFIGRIMAYDRILVTLEEVPSHLVNAIIVTEDSRFRSHPGYDWRGIARAALRNLRAGGVQEGGSTITQQLARQTFALQGRTLHRKLLELFLARRIERHFTKDEILECYLNRIYFGSGYWGVGAAARGYFGKEVGDLTVEESTLLAGLVRNPSRYSPFVNPEQARRVRNVALRRLAAAGHLDPAQASALQELPLTTLSAQHRPAKARYLLDDIAREARQILGPGVADHGELQIETTLDLALQRRVLAALQQRLDALEAHPDYRGPTYAAHCADKLPGEPAYLQGSILMIDNETGGILASVGGRDYRHSQFSRGLCARRPAGTAFAPFVYAAAYDSGALAPTTRVLDLPMNNRQVMVGGLEGILGEWGAEHADNRFLGEVTSAYALLWSKSGATVRVGNTTGLRTVQATARAAGIESPLRDYPSTFLGSSEVSLAELTRAYALFARNGATVERPGFIRRILAGDGRVLYERKPGPKRWAVKPLAAQHVHKILQSSLQNGTAFESRNTLDLRNPHAAGKTGTAYGFTDTWFIGYDREITCGVWIGADRPRPIFPGAFSRLTALPVWVDCMNAAVDCGYQPAAVPPSTPGPFVLVCLHSGLRAGVRCTEAGPQGCVLSPVATLDLGPEGARLPPCLDHDHATSPAPHPMRAIPVELSRRPGDKPTVPVKSKSPHVVGPNPFLLKAIGAAGP